MQANIRWVVRGIGGILCSPSFASSVGMFLGGLMDLSEIHRGSWSIPAPVLDAVMGGIIGCVAGSAIEAVRQGKGSTAAMPALVGAGIVAALTALASERG
jgi:hypothetical protein